jgi:hypothetical protein
LVLSKGGLVFVLPDRDEFGFDEAAPTGVTLRHLAPTIGTGVYGLDLRKDLDGDAVAYLFRQTLAT